jgi:hypothetical protein
MRRFKKALIERALGSELTHHLGYPPGGEKPVDTTNHRNGTGGKTVLTDDGPLAIDVPRDRAGTFEPRLIPKHERRFTGFDDKIPDRARARANRPTSCPPQRPAMRDQPSERFRTDPAARSFPSIRLRY